MRVMLADNATMRHLCYWAKTAPGQTPDYHPVAYHGLDVAAVGRTLLDQQPRARARLARVAGMTEESAVALVTLLLSFHDLGKLADGFQNLAPDLMARLQGAARWAPYDSTHWKHDTVGYVMLEGLLATDGLAGLLPPETPRGERERFAQTWLSAAMGHHGVPPTVDAAKHRHCRRKQFPPAVLADLVATVTELRQLFLPAGLAIACDADWDRRCAAASWLFAGLAVTADWLGSNVHWFSACAEPFCLRDYFEQVALPCARKAVEESGLGERAVAARVGFGELWQGYEPTQLQRLADEMPLEPGPQLIVIEEVTGGGKTEAAFTLAHRLIAAGRAEGLYIGLPTMATANAMYDRLETAYRRLYAAGSEPSLVLAHARRHLRLALDSAAQEPAGEDDTAGDDDTADAQCTAWLADSRKKALLAEVGIGTIDQALLGILPARHQSMRLWGLAGKVLVVDEVHAADAYMQRLLARLLEFHASFGGCAVLLSATLSQRQRAMLCRAFARGADFDPPEIADRAYPALVYLSATSAGVYPLEARPEASREIAVRLLHEETAVDAQIEETLAADGCACWIRNTVGDAIAAWERWSRRLGAERVVLFHARFTVDDREVIEREVIERFGPRSGPAERAGRLVIATQVVEQSLDLDFDLLVSDLAPIDLLIQRAGRLRRHRRDASGARIEGTDLRGEPVFYVFSPPPEPECAADWFSAELPGAALVYDDHGALWLGARWLAERGRLRVPEDLRALIEHVYGGEAEDEIPEALLGATLKAEGKQRADSSTAGFNAITLAEGYKPTVAQSSWRSDVATPTRLGDPSTTVRLARRVEGGVQPWHAEGAYPWDRSQVSVRQSQVAAEHPDDKKAIERAKTAMPDGGRFAVVVLMREQADGSWAGRAMDGRGRTALLTYNSLRGLTVIKESPPRR